MKISWAGPHLPFLLTGLIFLSFSYFALANGTSTGSGQPGTASGQPGDVITLPNPLCQTPGPNCSNDIPSIIERIIRFLRDVAVPVVVGMVIYGAYQILFAGGDPEKFSVGKRTILYAVVGYAIIWVGWGIASIIRQILSGS